MVIKTLYRKSFLHFQHNLQIEVAHQFEDEEIESESGEGEITSHSFDSSQLGSFDKKKEAYDYLRNIS